MERRIFPGISLDREVELGQTSGFLFIVRIASHPLEGWPERALCRQGGVEINVFVETDGEHNMFITSPAAKV